MGNIVRLRLLVCLKRMKENVNKLPFVSVIVPVFEDWVRLDACIDCLEHQTYPRESFEIVVVNNGPSSVPERLLSAFPSVRWAEESENGSYAARNRGLSLAQGSILAFTDSDCLPDKDWLQNAFRHFMQNPEISVLGGRIELFFDNPQHPTLCERYEELFGFMQRYYIEQRHFAATANMFTRKETIDAVGPFNGALRSSGDLEWGERVYASGRRLLYAPDAAVRHPARSSFHEFVKKLVRVSQGYIARKLLDGYGVRSFIFDLAYNLAITVVRIHRVWFKAPHFALRERLGVTMLVLVQAIVTTFERIRAYAWLRYSNSRKPRV